MPSPDFVDSGVDEQWKGDLFLGPPIIFCLYDTVSGGAGVIQTDMPRLGYMKPQGTLPSGVASLAASYYVGSLATMSPKDSSDNGSLTLDSSGGMNVLDDEGGLGNTTYGDALNGLTLTPLSSFGVFNVQAAGETQIICYLMDPMVAGGPISNLPCTPYGEFACVVPSDGNIKVTLV